MKFLAKLSIPALPPSVNSIYSRSKYGVYKRKVAKNFENIVLKHLLKRKKYTGPLCLLIEYHIKSEKSYNKRDLDNFDKCLIDSLQLSGQIKNDNSIVFRASIKLQDKRNYVDVYLYSLNQVYVSIQEIIKKIP